MKTTVSSRKPQPVCTSEMEPEKKNPATMGEPETLSIPSQPFVGKLRRSMLPPDLQKKQARAKPRSAVSCALPMQLPSCIFPSPVTLITAHPGNEVRYGPHEEKLQKPQQLCASWRLQALKQQGTEEKRLRRLHFTNAFQILTSGSQGRSRGQAAAESSGPSPGLSPFWKEMILEACHLVSPSYNQQVTAADVQRQARKVKRARERLAKALRADSLAREAERLSGQEERAETQMDTGAGTGDSQV
ncbi:putative methyl-CpG-binding domain protein 3-like 5 [Fukomys damarensis]|uniref:putative methyl-CpG-binding domain protein 3-like 5 n=1 Tax=Fukomys damarensis TaxID=885580 RepID=UPI00053F78A0|nr:putative methyl-CpG-binding domain protein 3-like 5 [Fukomys damarensis]